MKYYLGFVVLLIIFLISMYIIQIYNNNKVENYRSYGIIEGERYNSCKVMLDTFMDSYVNAKDQINDPFLRWCYGYWKGTGSFPAYRDAEVKFLNLYETNKY